MSRIERALETAEETRAIEFGRGVLDRTGAMFRELFGTRPVLVVADENVFAQAGERVVASLRAAGVPAAAEPMVFPGTPTLYAGYENVTIVRDRLAELPDAVVCAIASGSLNDIAKLASGELGRPYMNVCTAASVDGYSAFGASIAIDGFKITRSCPAPVGLIADLDIVEKAPQRLTSTGYGDLSEKVPAGADWILADELGVEPIDPVSWSLVQDSAWEALEQPEAIGASEPQAVAALMESLLLSGLGMQANKSSRPASGAGHQFSHLWEMEGHGLDWEPPLSHGFKVGVGAVASCAIWEAALAFDLETLDVDRVLAQAPSPEQVEAEVRAAIPATFADESVAASQAKQLRGDALAQRLALIQQRWPAIVERVRPQLVSPTRMMELLRLAGAPHHPSQIGIGMDRFRATHQAARMIRPRYTIFDVLADLGVYQGVVDDLFGPTGFWGRHP
ncbi:sn-glycerol-1-phosphate dehydrogenase [Pseudactinotalea sp.]|uniref:sn-glycerol-1-phosphate dehydrogenase n=1 Tax=Pseudactinotalea sp. TaxID=1926260 RepID=UPI003B3A1CE0